MVRRDEIPPFMDLEKHRVKLGIGLGIGLPAAGLTLWAYGITPLGIAFAAGTAGLCLGIVYLIDRLGRTID